ncbi:MAG: hypothetical protein FVQ79_02260 [Planctomycetes bacterium]|nr:hypothetical protein [Planctomycetota bacterium]
MAEIPERIRLNIKGITLRQYRIPRFSGDRLIDYAAWGAQPPENEMLNYDRLSRWERSVMNGLPGFAEGELGKTLAWFGGTWAGKFLVYFDIGAEALERTTGVFAQWSWAKMADAEGDENALSDFWSNLGAAWTAGALTADMTNMPRFAESESGVIEFGVTQDLPGVWGIVSARQKLVAGASLEEVRNEYYDSVGALALRAQIQDAYFHMFADPSNIILPRLKIPTRLKTKRIKLLSGISRATTKTAIVEQTTDLNRMIGIVENLDDLGDVAKVIAEGKAAGQIIEDFPRIQNIISDLGTTATKADVLEELTSALREAEKWTEFSWAQQKILQITGGLPGQAPSRFWGSRINPIALTPAAKAHNLLVTSFDNTTAYLIGRGFGPEEIARNLRRILDGTAGPELGHMILTPEGRALRGAWTKVSAEVDNLYGAWKQVGEYERPMMLTLERLLGETREALLKQIVDGEELQIFNRLISKLDDPANAEISQVLEGLLQHRGLTMDTFKADELAKIGGILKGQPLLSQSAFETTVLNFFGDTVAQHAIVKFGLASGSAGAKLINDLADTIKSAETLIFLRMNVGYPIKNYLNNIGTMAARGVFGSMTGSQIDEAIDIYRINFARLETGFGPGEIRIGAKGVAGAALREAEQLMLSAGRGEKGVLRKMTDAISGFGIVRGEDGIRIGRRVGSETLTDFGHMAAGIERTHSKRAGVVGFMQGHDMFLRPGVGFKFVPDDLVAIIGEEVARTIERKIASARNFDEIQAAVFTSENINLSWKSVQSAVEGRLGVELDDILPSEFTARWGPEIMEAAVQGRDEVANVLTRARRNLSQMMDGAQDDILESMGEEIENLIGAERQMGFSRLFGDAMDDMLGTAERHQTTIAKIAAEIRQEVDPAIRNARWRSLQADSEAFYGRYWKRMQVRFEAIEKLGVGGYRPGDLARIGDDVTDLRLLLNANGITEADLVAVIGKQIGDISLDEGRNFAAKLLGDQFKDFAKPVEPLFGAENIMKDFGAWRDGWQEFYTTRNGLWNTFFDESNSGATLTKNFDQVTGEVDRLYEKMFLNEDFYMRRLDNTLIQMVPPEQRVMFKSWRDGLADLRMRDRQNTLTFRQAIRNAPIEQQEALYQAYKAERFEMMTEIRKAEQMGRAAMSGSPEGVQIMTPVMERFTQAQINALKAGDLSGVFPNMERMRISDLPEALQQPFRERLQIMAQEIFEGDFERGFTVEKWYRDLFGRGGDFPGTPRLGELTGQNAVIRALNDIEGGVEQGTRSGREYIIYERLRREILKDVPIEGLADDLLADVANEAMESAAIANEARAAYGDAIGMSGAAQNMPMTDYYKIYPRQRYNNIGFDELFYNRASSLLDDISTDAIQLAEKPALRFSDLPPEAEKGLRRYMAGVEGDYGSIRLAATQFGSFRRDSALLNYSRRTNLDAWLGTFVPFEFWMVHSMANWAIESLQQPAYLSQILRMKKLYDTGFAPDKGFPSRLRNHISIKVPFLPKMFGDWIGDRVFINPLKAVLPLEQFAMPFEMAEQQMRSDQGSAMRVLEEMLNDNMISEDDYLNASETLAGPTWDRAVELSRQDDDQSRMSGVDFLTTLLMPHAPIMWGIRMAQGRTEEIGTLLPFTRTLKAATSLLGINNGQGINIEGSIREAAGLPRFSKWDDYRTERMLTNMGALGEYTLDEINRAWNERSGPLWDEAERRAGIEFGVNTLVSSFGIPLKAYPPGEEHLRGLAVELDAAYDEQEAGNETAVNEFFDENPEYELRLSLWDSPEERMQAFLVDEVWARYNELNTLDRRLLNDQMGAMWEETFLSKETRSYDSIPTETLAVWLKLMGGDPPGTLNTENVRPLNLAPPEISELAELFYATREREYGNYYELQSRYYELPYDQARQYLRNTPQLQAYFDFRRDFMLRNPSVAVYLSDNPPQYRTLFEREQAEAIEPQLTVREIRNRMYQIGGGSLANMVEDWAYSGVMSNTLREALQELADNLDIPLGELLERIQGEFVFQ